MNTHSNKLKGGAQGLDLKFFVDGYLAGGAAAGQISISIKNL
jgi:hypothetical protein